MRPINWKREGFAALLLIVFGVAALPALVYLVGQEILGSYEGPDGLLSLYGAILESLVRGQIATWVLVLSPYLFILLIRLFVAVRRRRPGRRTA